MGQRQKHGYNHGDILLLIPNHLLYKVRISGNHSNSILILFIVGSFKHCKYLSTCGFQIIIKIQHPLTNFFRLFHFPTLISSHTLGLTVLYVLYTNTLEQAFEAKLVNLGKTSIQLTISITDIILRSPWCLLWRGFTVFNIVSFYFYFFSFRLKEMRQLKNIDS